MLDVEYAPQYKRDYKRFQKKHADMGLLDEVMRLIAEDTRESRKVLKQRHKMHALKGVWAGSQECHAANAGDWLVIWRTGDGLAVFQRTGSHDELFA